MVWLLQYSETPPNDHLATMAPFTLDWTLF